MQAIFPNVVEEFLLSQLIALAVGNPFKIHLYTNNLTPDENTVLGDFTEASYTEYVVQDWDPNPVSEVGGKAQYEPANVTFAQTADGTTDIYGFFVTDNGSTNLLMCGRLDGAPYDVFAAPLYLHLEWKLYDKNS